MKTLEQIACIFFDDDKEVKAMWMELGEVVSRHGLRKSIEELPLTMKLKKTLGKIIATHEAL